MSKETITEVLKNNDRKLSISSIYTYSSTLFSLYKKVFGNSDIDIEKFNDTEEILKALEDKRVSSRKTALSALYVLTGLPIYRELMMNDIEEVKQETDKQTRNEKQEKAHRTQKQIKDKLDELRERAIMLYSKRNITMRDVQEIQQYILFCLTSGVYFPPRRSLDWCEMKTSNIDRRADNYIKKDTFIFNTYKGSKQKGEQRIAIPDDLQTILKRWRAFVKKNVLYPGEEEGTYITTEYLLFDNNGKALNNVKLNQRLNKIMGKGASINTLRHSYLSEKFGDTIKRDQELADTMEKMGSSTLQKSIYIQHDKE